MTGKLHQTLVMVAGIVAMIAGIVVVTDPSTLGVSADTWKLISGWFAFGSGVLAAVTTVLRANLLPGVSTGVGNEAQGITRTVTSETKVNP